MPDLLGVIGVAAPGWAYLLGLHRLWAAAGWGRGVRPAQAGAFLAGVALLAVAVLSPLDQAGERRLSAHMAQHLLLGAVVPPLLALGAPVAVLARALPGGRWRRLGPSRWPSRRWLLAAVVAQAAVLWAWHAPALYQAALASHAVHAAEHVSFVVAGLALWLPILAPGRRGYGPGVVATFVTTLPAGVLGALLTLAPRPWYRWYAERSAGALADQQLAGLLMWVGGGLVAVVAAVALLVAWLAPTERPEQPS